MNPQSSPTPMKWRIRFFRRARKDAADEAMAGVYEVRVHCEGMNHRLFCLLDRDASDLGSSSIACLGGLSKRPREAAHDRDYKQIKRFADEFARSRRVFE